jgi:phage tail sheath protein FI
MQTAPGVYIQETSSGVHTITGVSTSLTAFVGTALLGPVNIATRVQSFAEYITQFGGVDPSSEMSYAVMQYFLNGGSDAYVIRVAANAAPAMKTIKDATNAFDTVQFTAIDGGAAGNGVAVAIDYLTSDANRFAITLTGVPDASGNSTVEQYSGVSMNSTDAKYVERVINGPSNLVSVKRVVAAANFGKGKSVNKTPAAIATTNNANTIRIAVDGKAPASVSFAAGLTTGAAIVGAINTALPGQVNATSSGGNQITIESATPSDHSAVVVLPGLTNDAAKMLGLGLANGGVETDGSSVTRPMQSPDPGKLTGAAYTAVTIKGSIALTLDDGRPVNIPLDFTAMPIANQSDANAIALALQNAVSSFRPTVTAFSRFTVALDFATKKFTLASGTRGAKSAVLVTDVSASDTTATKLGLNTPPATQTAGGVQVLTGGNEDPLNAANTYATFVPSPASKGGIYALENVDLFNILCVPGIADTSTLMDAAAYCESRRAFLIVDPPTGQKPTDIEALVSGTAVPKSDHAAIYYPYIQIGDPLTGGLRLSAPSGTLAGIYARTDSTRGVWKAPAGTDANLKGVQQLEYTMTDGENGIINPLGANAIRLRNPYGIISWGARTLRGADDFASEYKYVPIRRLALYIEESLYRGTQWVVFEPNDEPLWAQIRLNVGVFMNTLFRQGAFEGASPRDAYFVKCDHDTTTQADIDRGLVNIIVGFAPLKPAEFVIISIAQIAGQLTT